MPVLAKDIMTPKVITLSPDEPLAHAVELFSNHRIGGAPVVDAHGTLVGIVTQDDILRYVASRAPYVFDLLFAGSLIVPDEETFEEKTQAVRRLHVRDAMTRRVISVAEDTPCEDVARILMTRRIKRVPVLRDGNLVGVVARGDIVRAVGDKRDTRA